MRNKKRKNPLVSVLLNCYNAEKYIHRAIKSLILQNYKNWELIIWDDGSQDQTLKIIKKFDDKRIKIFSNKKNIGLGKSRCKAIRKLKGNLVAILDADDFFYPGKLKAQVKVFQKHKNVSICSTWSKMFKNKKIHMVFESKLKNYEIKNRLNFINIFPHSSIMYRKNIAIKLGWYSKKLEYSQDYDLTLRLIRKYDLFLIKKYLTGIELSSESMTSSKKLSNTILLEKLEILKKVKKINNLNYKDYNILETIISMTKLKLFLNSITIYNFLLKAPSLIIDLLFNPNIIFRYFELKNFNEFKKI